MTGSLEKRGAPECFLLLAVLPLTSPSVCSFCFLTLMELDLIAHCIILCLHYEQCGVFKNNNTF